jgi:hypothetical protein
LKCKHHYHHKSKHKDGKRRKYQTRGINWRRY